MIANSLGNMLAKPLMSMISKLLVNILPEVLVKCINIYVMSYEVSLSVMEAASQLYNIFWNIVFLLLTLKSQTGRII